MPAPCKICSEPGVRDSVDRRLRDREPIRDIAAAVQRSKSSVARHKAHASGVNTASFPVLKGSLRASQAGRIGLSELVETPEDYDAHCQALYRRALSVMDAAKKRNDLRGELLAVESAAKNLERVGKARGWSQEGPTTDARSLTVNVFSKLPAPVIEALEDPDRAAVILRALESPAMMTTLSSLAERGANVRRIAGVA